MKNKNRKSQSSSDSCDDQPLKKCKSQDDINSYGSLLKRSFQLCELCEKPFNNRYKILIHNAKHIIIPLLKQTLHQCPECLFQFKSLEDLDLHTNKKHVKSISSQDVPDLSIVKLEFDAIDKLKNPGDCQIPRILQGLDEQPTVKYENEKLKLNIKQRIVFEDDMFDDDLFDNKLVNNSTTDCQIGNEKFESPLLIDSSKLESDEIDNSTKLESSNGFKKWIDFDNSKLNNNNIKKLPVEIKEAENNHSKFKNNKTTKSTELINKRFLAISDRFYKSVHYSELINSGELRCQWCRKKFLNRIELLKHEPLHMRLRQFRTMICSVCERYIAGNYRNLHRHIAEKHPDQINKKFTLHKCRKCSLKYHNYYKHLRNYHFIYMCKTCGKSFDDEKDRSLHIHEHLNQTLDIWDSKTVKMCDLCYSFKKNKQNLQYQWLGEVHEMGVRQECDKCCHKFFEVNLVKTSNKLRDYTRQTAIEKSKKPLTNEERLRKLQLRLKKINKMNKL